ncbi:ATP-binding protein [bacterium]|nr:ATP-binding protein [bacterium]
MDILGITKLNIADQNAIINQISNTYKDFFRAAMEYIDNSIDIATINKINGLDRNYKVHINIDTYNKIISFLDNCGGMSPDELCNLLSNVGLSTKKAVSWANGQFGFGVHAFRAFAKTAQFISKKKNYPACKIIIDRDKTEHDEVYCKKVPDDTLVEEGTEVIVSNFNKHVFKKNEMKRKLSEEISRHFDDILRGELIDVFILENGSNKIKLLPFDYRNMDGIEFPKKKIKVESRSKTLFLDIDLKILDQPQKNRLPIIKNKGRRIQSIADIPSYKKHLNSIGKNNYIWGNNEFIVGSIEINDFCSPKITRDDLIDNEERNIFYKELVEIQGEIEELFNKKQYLKKQEHLDEISHKITNCLNNVMRNFKLKFEIQKSSQLKGQDDKESIVDINGSNWGGVLQGGGSPGMDNIHGKNGCKWQVEMHLARKTILHLLERKKWFNPPLLFEF